MRDCLLHVRMCFAIYRDILASAMKCPHDSSDLQSASYKGSEIHVCVECKGIWLNYGVLTEILRVCEPDWSAEREAKVLRRLAMYNIAPMGEDRDLLCPICSDELDEVNYQGTSNIIVNPCNDGHGLWLDHGELISIRVFLNHWALYAQTHESEIGELLSDIDQKFGLMKAKVISQAPGMSNIINEMIYEALKSLDRD